MCPGPSNDHRRAPHLSTRAEHARDGQAFMSGPRVRRFRSVASIEGQLVKIATGVNRSGTSFTANLLLELKADLGPPALLLGPDHRNERGYFENKEILAANIGLLLGHHVNPKFWADQIEGRPVPRGIRLAMAAAKLQYFTPTRALTSWRAKKMSARLMELGRKYENVIVNDARFSSTLSVWCRYVPISRVLYIYRNPSAVVRSLEKAYGLPRWAGYIFWRQRVDEFFAHVADVPFIMVHYDSFFDDRLWRHEIGRLYKFIDKPFDEREGLHALERTRESRLRHWGEEPLDNLPRRVVETYRRLHSIHRDHAELTPIRASAPRRSESPADVSIL